MHVNLPAAQQAWPGARHTLVCVACRHVLLWLALFDRFLLLFSPFFSFIQFNHFSTDKIKNQELLTIYYIKLRNPNKNN
jgi:hypothetical protein